MPFIMEERPKFWLDWLAQVALRLHWPSNRFVRVMTLSLSGLALSAVTAVLLCLPDPVMNTIRSMLDPVSPAALIFVAALGSGLAAAGLHYGISLLHRRLLEFPSYVLDRQTRDLIWSAVCKAIRRVDFFSLEWAHSFCGMVWAALWVAFIAYISYLIHITVITHLYTEVALMGIIGICAGSVLYGGFSVLFSGLWSVKSIEQQIRDGLRFDPADLYSYGGLAPLMSLVNAFIRLLGVLSLFTWGVAYRVLASSNVQVPLYLRWAISPALVLHTVRYPFHEKIFIAFVLFLELLATILMFCVWIKGFRWIVENRKQVGESLAEKVWQHWNGDSTDLAANVLRLQLVQSSGGGSVGGLVGKSVLVLVQLVTLAQWLISFLNP